MSSTEGGGIEVFDGVVLVYSTVVGNTAPDAANVLVNSESRTITTFGSVIAVRSAGARTAAPRPPPSRTVTTTATTPSCDFTDVADGRRRERCLAAAQESLAANGGPTETMLPAAGYPADRRHPRRRLATSTRSSGSLPTSGASLGRSSAAATSVRSGSKRWLRRRSPPPRPSPSNPCSPAERAFRAPLTWFGGGRVRRQEWWASCEA